MLLKEKSALTGRAYIILLLSAISVLTVVAYAQIIQCGFVSFDDSVYVLDNDNIKNGFTAESIRWALTTSTDGNWFPLTWLSYMLDIVIAGDKAVTYHVINLLYHLFNSILLFAALFSLTGHINRSALVTALFAVHPLHVESVAWISERKDLLSTSFFLLTIIAYSKYSACRNLFRYLMTLILFVCGLMSKSMLVSTPLILLLLDYWPLNRFTAINGRGVRLLLLEKLPFFMFSLVSGIITYNVQKHKAVVSFDESPLLTNICNALVSYVMYLYKTFVPVKLSVMYPFEPQLSLLKTVAAAVVLIFVTAGVVLLRRKRPYLVVGWLWFLIALLPVIGIVRVGKQAMADRYTYIPHIGFFILLIWGLSDVQAVQKIGSKIKWAIVAALLSMLAILTWYQTAIWKNSISLFSNAVEVTENNWVALGALGYEYSKCNELNKAFELLNRSLALNPKYVMALYNMGILQNKLGQRQRALEYFNKILTIEPDYWMAHYQIGLQLLYSGDTAGALHEHSVLKNIDPGLSRQLLNEILMYKNASVPR